MEISEEQKELTSLLEDMTKKHDKLVEYKKRLKKISNELKLCYKKQFKEFDNLEEKIENFKKSPSYKKKDFSNDFSRDVLSLSSFNEQLKSQINSKLNFEEKVNMSINIHLQELQKIINEQEIIIYRFLQ